MKDAIDTMYREIVLELYRNPLHKKLLDDFDVSAKEYNPTCGDEISVQIKLSNETIKDIGHQGSGCAISQAATSLLLDNLIDKERSVAINYTLSDVNKLMGFNVIYTREKCATIGLDAIKKALK